MVRNGDKSTKKGERDYSFPLSQQISPLRNDSNPIQRGCIRNRIHNNSNPGKIKLNKLQKDQRQRKNPHTHTHKNRLFFQKKRLNPQEKHTQGKTSQKME